jgi:hypothetical protein
MRTFTYLALLPLAWFGSGVASIWLTLPFAKIYSIFGQYTAMTLISILAIPPSITKLLLFYRALNWIKARSLSLPNQYSGLKSILGTSIIATLPFIAAGYFYIISHNAIEIQGIPLGFVLNIIGVASAILIFICEIRNFYALLPNNSKRT